MITITTEALAVAIRAGTAGAVPADVAAVLGQLMPAGEALIAEYAPGVLVADLPDNAVPSQAQVDAVANVALIRLVGFLYDADPAETRQTDPLLASGAASILGPWRIHRAAAIDAGPIPIAQAAAPAGAVQLPVDPPDGVYVLEVLDGAYTLVPFPAPR